MRPLRASSISSSGWKGSRAPSAAKLHHAPEVAGQDVDLDVERPAGLQRIEGGLLRRVRDDVDGEADPVRQRLDRVDVSETPSSVTETLVAR